MKLRACLLYLAGLSYREAAYDRSATSRRPATPRVRPGGLKV
ncbi:MAG: hypothetical protein QW057_07445 [Candidatus Bathyarchaeia archaeon]